MSHQQILSPNLISRPMQGVLWMIACTLSFVAVTGIVRHLGSNLPAAESAFIRYAMGFVIMFPVFWRMRNNMPPREVWINGAIRGFVLCGWLPFCKP